MRYKPLSGDFYKANRKAVSQALNPASVAVILSNDQFPTNADGHHPFKQNNDLFYLTGIDQEETMLLMAPDHPDPAMREILFLKETNEHTVIWEGRKMTKAEGSERSGVGTVKWNHEFDQVLHGALSFANTIYLYKNEHDRLSSDVITAHDRFANSCRQKYPAHSTQRLAPLVHKLRTRKKKEEIEAIKAAISITHKGFEQAFVDLKPGMMEYALEAQFSKTFIENGASGFAYEPIVAGGANSCILHYINNDQPLHDGDLVLMDIGAAYGGYNGDVTRTVPVNGRFTKRQLAVYSAVLDAKQFAQDLLAPGVILRDYQEEVGKYIESLLVGLGLLEHQDIADQDPAKPLYKKYFMHGTSHFLGLDVHDVGSRFEPLEEGMILTVEPGIYIREEGIGIRLEDDVLITANGCSNLSSAIPILPEEIEDRMSS